MKVKISCLKTWSLHSYVDFKVDVPDHLKEDQVEEYLNNMKVDFGQEIDALTESPFTWGDGNGLNYYSKLGFEGGEWIGEDGKEIRFDIVGKNYGGHLCL